MTTAVVDPQLEVLLVPVESVQEWPGNPRRGDEAAIKASLLRWGQKKPIVVQASTGRIAAGNHLYRVAKNDLGWTHIAANIVEMTDADAEAFLLVDNRAADLGWFDNAALSELLQKVAAEDNLDATGYSESDIENLLAEVNKPSREGMTDPDDVPDIDEEADAGTVRGDLWLLGDHRLMCGDSLDAADLTLLLNGQTPDMILTDPPYGINLDTDYRKMGTGSLGAKLLGQGPKKYAPVIGDDKPFDASWLSQQFDDVDEQFWFGANYYRRTLPGTDLDGSWFVWDKRSETSDAMFGSGFELIWSRQKHKQDLLRFFFAGAFGAEARDRVHPTQKPTALLVELMERFSESGALVVDVFAGSGSTLIAAEKAGRRCYAMELSPHYVRVIVERFAKHTGIEPRLIRDGEEQPADGIRSGAGASDMPELRADDEHPAGEWDDPAVPSLPDEGGGTPGDE